jgi:hypothetical protein
MKDSKVKKLSRPFFESLTLDLQFIEAKLRDLQYSGDLSHFRQLRQVNSLKNLSLDRELLKIGQF